MTCASLWPLQKCIEKVLCVKKERELVGRSQGGLQKVDEISPILSLKKRVGFQERWGKL
jgi:hypothetical protein